MRFVLFLFSLISLSAPLYSEDEMLTFTLQMDTQVLDGDRLLWSNKVEHVLPSGSPVNFQLAAQNLKMVLRLTCYPADTEHMILVVQSEILLKERDGAVNFYSNFKTIQMAYNDPVLYFPLGTKRAEEEHLSLLKLVLNFPPPQTAGDASLDTP